MIQKLNIIMAHITTIPGALTLIRTHLCPVGAQRPSLIFLIFMIIWAPLCVMNLKIGTFDCFINIQI